MPHAACLAGGTVSETFRVVPARSGDHHAIYRLLASSPHPPNQAEFHAQLEDPSYEPTDRLIVKREQHVLAHALLLRREMHFGRRTLPVLLVRDFVVLPEFHGRGIGSQLLAAVDARLAEESAALALLRTAEPPFFQHRGWHVCLRHSYSTASAREILSCLGAQAELPRSPLCSPPPTWTVRIWRHVELAALIRLHAAHAKGSYGALLRDEACWSWLISRHGFDRIYIAVRGTEECQLNDTTPIVGYAVMQQQRILELVTDPRCQEAGRDLLARACRDAIEQDLHHVRFDAPPRDPLHAVFAAAGGRQCYHEAENGAVFMLRLRDPQVLLRTLQGEIIERCREAAIALPCELGLSVGSQKQTIHVDSRRLRIIAGRLGRSYVECSPSGLTQLLLGHTDVPSALESGRIHASTRIAAATAAALFPQLPVWRPPWDESPA
jgi:predicted N-acetyltransferase YhbS